MHSADILMLGKDDRYSQMRGDLRQFARNNRWKLFEYCGYPTRTTHLSIVNRREMPSRPTSSSGKIQRYYP